MTDTGRTLSSYEQQMVARIEGATSPVQRSAIREELVELLSLQVRDVGDQDDIIPGALLLVLRRNNHWLDLGNLLSEADEAFPPHGE